MNSDQLQQYLLQACAAADVEPTTVTLLRESMACYLGILARHINATSTPPFDLMGTSASLLLLSNAVNELAPGEARDSIDYLIGMGFEQSGELLSRFFIGSHQFSLSPMDNDYWYRLTLSLLHYLAGGFRVQAFSVVQNMKEISKTIENEHREEYQQAYSALRRLYSGRSTRRPVSEWEQILFTDETPSVNAKKRIQFLASRIRQRRQVTLEELGEGNEAAWLMHRGIANDDSIKFWQRYLSHLDDRGITSFTDEQRGAEPGFDLWLQPNRDLLVVLPTGAGKTIIGELKTAITLSMNKQVIWILPTRSLVRQTRRFLASSFRDMEVIVEELPTTEDFLPLFADNLFGGRYIAVTTPEKLAALIRTNPDAISHVGLVVLDEAQNLFDIHRGATFEFVIQSLSTGTVGCSLVLMSAMADSVNRLRLFLQRLRQEVPRDELISENRPTRRINGVLTRSDENKPVILCFPPGVQTADGYTIDPYEIHLDRSVPFPNQRVNSLALSLEVLKSLTKSKLRTVLFVEKKVSTITQARTVAEAIEPGEVVIPQEDIDRLQTELGRESVIVRYGAKGVVPHHAGLAPVEQHLIEKWISNGYIRTVVATPTLAQGVNLPFDISIVSFLNRFNNQGNREDISQSEILNMLGRAGRAGYVSDGVCLIAARRDFGTPNTVLDSHRRYYFQRQEASSNFLGLSRLMISANNSHVDDPNWLYELGNMSLSEAQSLISFSLRATVSGTDVRESLSNRLQLFPSIQDLREYYGEGLDVLDILAGTLEPLVENLNRECGDDARLLDALMRTGMPIQVLRMYFDILPNVDREIMNAEETIAWADQVVFDALSECNEREWYLGFFDRANLELPRLFAAIRQWRSGAPIRDIERDWQYRASDSANQMAIGEFLNHKISLLAQFWGALSVCEEIVSQVPAGRFLENIQLYVREGISSVSQLVWLKRTGSVDRVLAHTLAESTPQDLDRQMLRFFVERQLGAWRENRGSIPAEISNEKLGALISILNE